jgi:hypothetical protein
MARYMVVTLSCPYMDVITVLQNTHSKTFYEDDTFPFFLRDLYIFGVGTFVAHLT